MAVVITTLVKSQLTKIIETSLYFTVKQNDQNSENHNSFDKSKLFNCHRTAKYFSIFLYKLKKVTE
jgi:hypothetical protein